MRLIGRQTRFGQMCTRFPCVQANPLLAIYDIEKGLYQELRTTVAIIRLPLPPFSMHLPRGKDLSKTLRSQRGAIENCVVPAWRSVEGVA